MLKIWGRRSSANVQKAMWLIGELDLPHEHIQAGGPHSKLNTPEFLAKNPHALVPVIEDDGHIIWELNAVVRYLAARYGRRRFWDDDPAARANWDKWMDWSATTLAPNMIGLFRTYWRTLEQERNWNQIEFFQERAAHDLQLLDRLLATQPYLAGGELTLADIPSAPHVHRYYTIGLPVPSFPHVEAWYGRLKERAAFREHVMVSYEELWGRLSF